MTQHAAELEDYKARFAANIPNPTDAQLEEYYATVERLEKVIADSSAE